MNKTAIWLGLLATTFLLSETAYADIVSVSNSKGLVEVTDRSTLTATVGKSVRGDNNIVVIVPSGKAYVCQESWDPRKAKKAAERIVNYFNRNNHIDILGTLSATGLRGCRPE